MALSSSVEKLAGLKRRIDITVPVEDVDSAYNGRVNKLTKTVRIDGFRPGKVPAKVVEKRFGQNVLMEIAQELIQKHLVSAIQEHKLQVAGTPHVTPKELQKGHPLEFSAEFEIYPEIILADLTNEKIEREVVEISDQSIDNILEKLRKQQAVYKEVDRACAEGDRVVIDFEGSIEGKSFEHGSAKDFQLDLGSKQMIEGFEVGVEGAKIDEIREVKCTFPKDYPGDDLAGKEALFKVTVKKVMEAELPTVDDDFARRMGIDGGLGGLKDDIRNNMKTQADQMGRERIKQTVMDRLIKLNPIELPETLIDGEIEHLREFAKKQAEEMKKDFNDANFSRDRFLEQASRRVTLGLLLGEVIKQHALKIDSQKVRERVEQIASVYHQPEEVINWYYNNKRMLAEVESVVLEDQAVEKLLETMQVETKTISYEKVTEAVKAEATSEKNEKED